MAGECPDLLIIDVGVADYPWQEIVTAFREKHREVEVLALCGPDRADSVRTNGADRIREALVRPVSFDDLLLRIQHCLSWGTSRLRETGAQVGRMNDDSRSLVHEEGHA